MLGVWFGSLWLLGGSRGGGPEAGRKMHTLKQKLLENCSGLIPSMYVHCTHGQMFGAYRVYLVYTK